MKQVFVDTGAWYALIDSKDPDHPRVAPVFRTNRSLLVTSNYVVDETLTLLRYRLGWRIAHAFGEQIRGGNLTRLVRIGPADEDVAWDIFSRYDDKSFSFTDCTSFAVIRRLKVETTLAIDGDFRSYGLYCLP